MESLSLSGEVSLGLNDVDGEDVGGHGEGEVEPAAALRVVTPAQVGDTLLPSCCLQRSWSLCSILGEMGLDMNQLSMTNMTT